MDLNDEIKKIKEEIVKEIKPLSIFIYGSYYTQDFIPGVSDVEIGVIKRGRMPVFKTLREITKKYCKDDVRFKAYSYHLEDLKKERVDSPFTDSVFIRRLILTSKTIWGENIIENLSLPSIELIDAYREACFSTARALSALLMLRSNKEKEAQEISSKACLFATASFTYLNGEFPASFKEIVEILKSIRLKKEQKKIVRFAYDLRKGAVDIGKEELYDFIFETIKYCNQTVEERIKKELKKGNRILVK